MAGLLLQGWNRPHRHLASAGRAALWLGGRLAPVLLSAGYATAVAIWWRDADGGFGSLDAVARLFQTPGVLLAGWVHFLAFDLWVGRRQVDDLARQPGLSVVLDWACRLTIIPCLLLTFMFGTVGLLMYFGLRQLRRLFAAEISTPVATTPP